MPKPSKSNSIEIPDVVIKDFLTESEMIMVKQRFLIASLLDRGLSIRAVAQRAKVGTDTVVRISRMVKDSIRLKDLFKKPKEGLSTSKWVFGGIDFEKQEK